MAAAEPMSSLRPVPTPVSQFECARARSQKDRPRCSRPGPLVYSCPGLGFAVTTSIPRTKNAGFLLDFRQIVVGRHGVAVTAWSQTLEDTLREVRVFGRISGSAVEDSAETARARFEQRRREWVLTLYGRRVCVHAMMRSDAEQLVVTLQEAKMRQDGRLEMESSVTKQVPLEQEHYSAFCAMSVLCRVQALRQKGHEQQQRKADDRLKAPVCWGFDKPAKKSCHVLLLHDLLGICGYRQNYSS